MRKPLPAKQSAAQSSKNSHRLRIFFIFLLLLLFAVQVRLFYWQVIKGNRLQAQADQQYQQIIINTGKRGSIYTSDGALLVGNQRVFRLFAEPQLFSLPPEEIADKIFEPLLSQNEEFKEASEASEKETIKANFENYLKDKLLNSQDKRWLSLLGKVDEETKDKLETLEIKGLGFDPFYERFYPEASLAAHVVGFVGKDKDDQPMGYFGVEGALNKELSAKTNQEIKAKFSWSQEAPGETDGRDIFLTIRRDLQFLAEKELKAALERYGATAGEVIIMDSRTGKIRALASLPQFDPKKFYQFPNVLYKNPSVSDFYEPGSTFKVLTVATGIDTGAITPETVCDNCSGPRKIDKYTIRTWNDVYNPDIDMTGALAKSDNIAMIFAEEKIGKDDFIKYLKKFGIGEKVTNDLQEDVSPSFPDKWGVVELATRSFGQGVSTTSLQMIRAINAIANQGVMLQPLLIDQVRDPQSGEAISSQPIELNQVVSQETAQAVSKMMIESANHGEAQWIASKKYLVAGKTGTSQVPKETGGYYDDKTIASFIGFAPADNPEFTMLVKLIEPTSSPWAAETAAPLWYRLADQLMLMW